MKFLPLPRLGGELATTAGAFLFLLIATLFPLFAQEVEADFEFLPSLAAKHSGTYIIESVSFPPVNPVIDGGKLSGAFSQWQFGFLSPPDEEVPAAQGVYALFHGTFGDVEDDVLVSGENYVLVQAIIPAGIEGDDPTATTTVSLSLNALLGDPDTPSGSYTLIAARLPTEKCVYNEDADGYDCEPYTIDDFLAWFAGGSAAASNDETFSPDNLWSIQFDYVAGGTDQGCESDCFSNVLFLPGIKGSRLYRAADSCGESDFSSCAEEEKLWEPGLGDSALAILFGAGNDDVRDLFLDGNGKSVRNDIYVKTNGVIDSAAGGDYYKSFMEDMDVLAADETIVDWEPVAYDWRLSLDDILANGAEIDGRISYTTATATPYIMQELRRLAGSSKSGKVTIIAHSNGGLVAKALLKELGDEEAAELVDKLILVGVPQSGAPRALGALLYGYQEGIPAFLPVIVGSAVAREFAENSPTAYHLLPSAAYFNALEESDHPVARFSFGPEGYAKEIAAYGETIDSADELKNFALATEGGRTKPAADDTTKANVLNSSLLDYASGVHDDLDDWAPPEDIEVYQIAGWGLNTIAGIEFYELVDSSAIAFGATHRRMHRPIFFEDGDGTVPSQSGLLIDSSSPNILKYWVNLKSFNSQSEEDKDHGKILEIQEVQELIEGLLQDNIDQLPKFVSEEEPTGGKEKGLFFFLHSPLTLGIKDGSGNYTGLNGDGTITNGIDGIEYGQFGEVQYLIVPQGAQYTLVLEGLSTGTFTLDIQEFAGDTVVTTTTLTNVPTTENTTASLQIIDGIESATPLSIDTDGDGDEDVSIQPQAGQIVFYVEEQEEENGSETALENTSPSSTDSSNAGGGGGGGGEGGVLYSTLSYGFVASSTASTTAATTTDAAIASTTPVGLTGTTTSATSTPELPAEQEEVTDEEPVVEANFEGLEQIGEVPGVATTSEFSLPEAETQTASVFDAVSQQSWFFRILNGIYNSLEAVTKLFSRLF